MNEADELRKNAAACRALARQMKDARYRADLFDMAQTWEQLAAEKDGAAPVQPDAAKPQKT